MDITIEKIKPQTLTDSEAEIILRILMKLDAYGETDSIKSLARSLFRQLTRQKYKI